MSTGQLSLGLEGLRSVPRFETTLELDDDVVLDCSDAITGFKAQDYDTPHQIKGEVFEDGGIVFHFEGEIKDDFDQHGIWDIEPRHASMEQILEAVKKARKVLLNGGEE